MHAHGQEVERKVPGADDFLARRVGECAQGTDAGVAGGRYAHACAYRAPSPPSRPVEPESEPDERFPSLGTMAVSIAVIRGSVDVNAVMVEGVHPVRSAGGRSRCVRTGLGLEGEGDRGRAKASLSPRRASVSPERASVSPGRASVSPRRRSVRRDYAELCGPGRARGAPEGVDRVTDGVAERNGSGPGRDGRRSRRDGSPLALPRPLRVW